MIVSKTRAVHILRSCPAPLAAFLSGAAAAAGFQPLALWPLTLVALAVLLHLLSLAQGARRAMLLGWLFGVGHFWVGNTWIATAFTYQAEMPAWLGWIAVFLLSLFLAIYPAIAAIGAWLIARRGGLAVLVPAFAGTWIVAEWLRSWVFTGFAWNPLGVVTLGGFARPGLALLAPWLGTYALSAIVVLLAASWLWAVHAFKTGKVAPAIAAALVPVGLMVAPFPAPGQGEGTLPYRLVQPDIRQEVLNDPQHYEANFVQTAVLSGDPVPAGQTTLFLWPESGVPDFLRTGYPRRYYIATTYAADPELARRRLGDVVGPGGILLTGTVDLVMDARATRAVGAENVVTAVAADGRIAGSYAKAHLVPYGEYLPMRSLLEPLGLSRLVAGTLDFRAGPGPRTMDLGKWGRAGVQICYEIVFSGQVVDRDSRPDYLFNPSNDGWFGSWGPPQHLAQARLRAIEEGLPILRSTTTGISAVIDAGGVVRNHAGLHEARRLDGKVPPALAPTLFARTGNLLPLGWAMLLLVAAVVASRRARR
ncbi:apolipoprotein N-acyltransferase [Croceicoccus ponticola]|uniref:Apolipoprotein N-acyltransferase n=1 Tax=Croceicoccus ponticola TaxID=2217664 RepID=A0A437GXZ6_9SPHN|nr:apolipoprotein N-acyltransferase [Croceicoccus ponticola]RVQ67564.1 apolipoprotein N-acyltransferase [Croceicoccus ponticola]